MKATITLCVLLVLAAAAFVAEPALAAWSVASDEAIRTPEPALMLLSGALLLMAASLVRRYVP